MTTRREISPAEKLHQLVDKDNWDMIEECDNFLYVFDHLPPRMRLCVDLKMSGQSVKEIAKVMKVSERMVQAQLAEAKERIMRGENIG